MTVNVWSATATDPVRASPVFGSTAYATDPEPEPDRPDVMRIQEALGVAVHAHPELLLLLIAKVPLPPEEG